jgi:hypothetical protein
LGEELIGTVWGDFGVGTTVCVCMCPSCGRQVACHRFCVCVCCVCVHPVAGKWHVIEFVFCVCVVCVLCMCCVFICVCVLPVACKWPVVGILCVCLVCVLQ